jgi:hypothetical protein
MRFGVFTWTLAQRALMGGVKAKHQPRLGIGRELLEWTVDGDLRNPSLDDCFARLVFSTPPAGHYLSAFGVHDAAQCSN